MPDHISIEPFSKQKINHTTIGFTEIREGFTPDLPNVGTVTHEFGFTADPWKINADTGALLATLTKLKLSVSKVFNINNTTDTFYVLSWDPKYAYWTIDETIPQVNVYLFDGNGAVLDDGNLGQLAAYCEVTARQSLRRVINSMYFDRIQSAVFSLGPSVWRQCG